MNRSPHQASQDTLPSDPPLERQIFPTVPLSRVDWHNEGHRQAVKTRLYMSPDDGTGFTDSARKSKPLPREIDVTESGRRMPLPPPKPKTLESGGGQQTR